MRSSWDSPYPEAATGLQVRPFRALTYRRRDPGHLARVSSPAYDLVTPEGRDRLAAADPHNVVRLILPGVASGADGPGGDGLGRSVAEAAVTLRNWEQAGVLERDAEPALWVYALSPADGAPDTVGWLAAVELPPAGSRAVLPHEDTFPGAVEGRRALLEATATDLEPIVLAHDPHPGLPALTVAAQEGPPTLEVTDADGVRHALWRVSDPALTGLVTAALADTGAVIADGHHRFAAARAHGAQAILALVTPMGPGGLRVHPIHRVVPDLSLGEALAAASAGFRATELRVGAGGPAEAVERWISVPGEVGLLVSDGSRVVRLDSPSADVLDAVPAEAPEAWRGLDVVLVHHGLVHRLWGRADDDGAVLIAHGLDEALAGARSRHGVAVLLRAPSPADVAAVARANARMPRKSTLFVPKPRTGLVLRPHGD
ncbi:Uncharacterized conserved protein, DUF1015 family [Geodermatophilus poikilotrophus]|uniref:Uncharacterized conserved protein, DUF1015 family n=1 Tax=Geodermatophilus poikilotrophus TaxID=1333667 RepID=A0A1H9YB41_9ACTN|nr:DUF1015 domain-containing protein [Geodermatophilus poikilotrophus]SES66184.1 Uncharacterized conserved protein, DUF1015 family [Geodermatophilus poikilotrophus]